LLLPVLQTAASAQKPNSISKEALQSIFYIEVPKENGKGSNLGTAVLISKSTYVCNDINISPFIKECANQTDRDKLISLKMNVYNFLTAYHVVENRVPTNPIQFNLFDINDKKIPIRKSEVYKLPCINNPSLLTQYMIKKIKYDLNKDECFYDVAWIRVYTSYNLSQFMTLPKNVNMDVRDVQGSICGFGKFMGKVLCTLNANGHQKIVKIETTSKQSTFFRKIGGSNHLVLDLASNSGASGGPIFRLTNKKIEILGTISGRLVVDFLENRDHVAFVPINVSCRMLAPICTPQKTK
jgi:hypothetical protein